MNILQDRMRLVKGEMMDEFSMNRARQRLISRDAEAARQGRQLLRPTATRATEAAKEEALKLTTDALSRAGFPVREMRNLFGPNGPPDIAETLGELTLSGTKEKDKEQEEEKEKEDAKGKGKAMEVHHVAWKGGPDPTAASSAPAAAAADTDADAATDPAEASSANVELTKTQLRAAQRKAKKQRATEEEKE